MLWKCFWNPQGKCRLSLERSQSTDLLHPAFKLVVQTIQSVDGDADGKISFVEFQKVRGPYCISFRLSALLYLLLAPTAGIS